MHRPISNVGYGFVKWFLIILASISHYALEKFYIRVKICKKGTIYLVINSNN